MKARTSERHGNMEQNSPPSWLNQIQVISKSRATQQALEALNSATTPIESAIAEQDLTAAVLTDIAATMLQ
jgi:hypothetical protein